MPAPWCLLAVLLLGAAGCDTVPAKPAAAPASLGAYDSVGLLTLMDPKYEDVFLPAWMRAFPKQTLVGRSEVIAVAAQPNLRPEQLDAPTRAKLAKALGIKAVVVSNLIASSANSTVKIEINVIDLASGQIVVATQCAGSKPGVDALLEKAIATLRRESRRAR